MLISLASCSSKTPLDEQVVVPNEEIPTMSMKNATYVTTSGGIQPITVQAKTISIDDKTDTAELEGFSFSQNDGDLWGTAQKATVNSQTHDAALSGDIVIRKESDGFEVHAQSMQWNDEEQTIQSGADELVSIVFDTNNTILARGFSGNLKTNLYEFTEILEGVVRQ